MLPGDRARSCLGSSGCCPHNGTEATKCGRRSRITYARRLLAPFARLTSQHLLAGPGSLLPQNFAAVQAPLHGKRYMGRVALQQARRELHICSTRQNKTNQIYKLILHQRVNRKLLLSFANVAPSAKRGASADEDERLGCGSRMARVAGGGDGCRAAACAAAHASHSLTAAAATKARVA